MDMAPCMARLRLQASTVIRVRSTRQKGQATWGSHAHQYARREERRVKKLDEATSTQLSRMPADNTSENSELTASHSNYMGSARPRETEAVFEGSASRRQHTAIQLSINQHADTTNSTKPPSGKVTRCTEVSTRQRKRCACKGAHRGKGTP